MFKSRFSIRAFCLTAIMTALYVLLAMFSIKLGTLHITLASLPVVVTAVVVGPAEAAVAALLGEFLNQMLNYGFTLTTALWLIPPAVRGLIVGMVALRAARAGKYLELRPVLFYSVCVAAAVVTTVCNTAVIWLDSVLYHYYTFAYVFGSTLVRLFTGIVTAVLVTTVTIPLARILRRQWFAVAA